MSAIRCPHCDAMGAVCAHHQTSPLTLTEWLRCTNLECGHTFVSFTEVYYTVNPSATPRPGLNLPLYFDIKARQHAARRAANSVRKTQASGK